MKQLILILLALTCLTACGQDKENNQEDYITLVVRTQEEYEEGHIDWPYEVE